MKLEEQLKKFKKVLVPDNTSIRILEERAPDESTYTYSVGEVTEDSTLLDKGSFSDLAGVVGKCKSIIAKDSTKKLVVVAWYPVSEDGYRNGIAIARYSA